MTEFCHKSILSLPSKSLRNSVCCVIRNCCVIGKYRYHILACHIESSCDQHIDHLVDDDWKFANGVGDDFLNMLRYAARARGPMTPPTISNAPTKYPTVWSSTYYDDWMKCEQIKWFFTFCCWTYFWWFAHLFDFFLFFFMVWRVVYKSVTTTSTEGTYNLPAWSKTS